MSPLIEHAKRELELAGLFDKDADPIYEGEIARAVMRLVKTHAKEDHSGGSHVLVLSVFNKVINYKVLSPLTDDPDEWKETGPEHYQNKRQSSCFSKDGGKTYYDIDEKGWPMHDSVAHKKK